MENDVFCGFGVKVQLPERGNAPEFQARTKDAFLIIRETLTRIGIASYKTKTLYQSCHILQKKNQYAILSFKELFALDGKPTNLTQDDLARRNAIVQFLADKGLLTIIDVGKVTNTMPLSQIKILSHADKKNWHLQAKYQIGNRQSSQ